MKISKLNSKLPAITPLTSEQNGVIDLHGLKIIYGSHPLSAFTSEPASGGYRSNIDISSHGLSGVIWGEVSAQYSQGHPIVIISSISTARLALLSDVSISGAYAFWMVIGVSS